VSTRAPIYSAASDDAAEVRRALRICLAGMALPPALSCSAGGFDEWTRRQFLPVLAPHAMQARELALRAEASLLARADAALSLPEGSVQAGRALLSQRGGARHLPVLRRFAAAVAAGAAEGHFATVLALQAADFSVAVLPMLQCLLYCEWHAARPAGASGDLVQFFHSAGSALAQLPSLIKPHADDAPVRFAAVR
jgi:hypothetical protein